jgi:4'-phosphopantetheinyl transferase
MRWLIRGMDSLPDGLGWLTEHELRRADRLLVAKGRNDYLLRRFAAKEAVTRTAGLTGLARVEVRNAPSGAPYALIDGEPRGWEISLTDRAGWAVCLVSKEVAGCDLELVEPRSNGFVRDFFTDAERSYVDEMGDEQPRRAEAANLIWSAKESALKVLRTGLRQDTRDVEVHIQSGHDGDWRALEVLAPGARRFPGWWRRGGDFVLTVVSLSPSPPPQPLDILTGPFCAPASR